ncbi:MAG: hypothetical protein AAFU85_23465 [Planctomycetota bacterium]
MRTSFALLAIAILLLIAGLLWEKQSPRMWIRRQTLIPYVNPPVPESFRGEISYPTANRQGPTSAVDDGPSIYAEMYASGWRGCLWSFYVSRHHGGAPIWKLDRTNDLFQPPQPGHLTEATNDGWFACVAKLEERLATISEGELRRRLDSNIDQALAADKQRFLVAAGLAGVVAIGLALGQRAKRERFANKPT